MKKLFRKIINFAGSVVILLQLSYVIRALLGWIPWSWAIVAIIGGIIINVILFMLLKWLDPDLFTKLENRT